MLRVLCILALMTGPAAADVARYEIGPWPVVSKLIGYRDSIWFANSVKGVNHNSADIWRVPIDGREPRYEGHLFSQDAGDPVVHQGLLYWPLEDARAEPGIGAFDVTDGDRWEHGLVPTEQAFHVHAMAASDGFLYAALSAWTASIARSADGGATWTSIYSHPTPDRRVSRVTDLVALDDRLFGALNAPEGRSLIRVDDGSGESITGWPTDSHYADLVTHRGDVYGLVVDRGEASIWRTDGDRSEKIWTASDGWAPSALTSDGETFWMAGREGDAVGIWKSDDARSWVSVIDLEGGLPSSIVAYRGAIAVGGRGTGERGVLWVVRSDSAHATEEAVAMWPSLDSAAPGVDFDWSAAADRIDHTLSDVNAYGRHGSRLGHAIMKLPQTNVPGSFYNDRLQVDMPKDRYPMFADIVLPEAAAIGRWYLYWGMGLSRTGRVGAADVLLPWDYAPNGPVKYFSTPEIAMWAAARIGRSDPDLLDALIRRIEDPKTPLWLKGDAVGALHAITGLRHGYDARSWRAWFDQRP